MGDILKLIIRKFDFTSSLLDVFFLRKFYLKPKGWLLSRSYYRPMTVHKKALPWFTYPAIAFVSERINSQHDVFEFGSGNSTIFFSERVKSIVSVESDSSFFQSLQQTLVTRENVKYEFREAEGGCFSGCIGESTKRFDIVIVDGADRINCAKNAVQALKSDGLIVWDNSEREEYKEGYEFLTKEGFKRLDFWGHGPIGYREWCTSIFYRAENCFGI